ncbi:hypothetical protein E2C01_046954 [Portunus trituberculatus]|uniref:Uncharacterized protein n=1 Tax=Portunus trituberculatus TaxID=210409 RepID=A0A5B7FZ44_PORTR|nr:hypothetical protein [Portunus trituberculatus]
MKVVILLRYLATEKCNSVTVMIWEHHSRPSAESSLRNSMHSTTSTMMTSMFHYQIYQELDLHSESSWLLHDSGM